MIKIMTVTILTDYLLVGPGLCLLRPNYVGSAWNEYKTLDVLDRREVRACHAYFLMEAEETARPRG